MPLGRGKLVLKKPLGPAGAGIDKKKKKKEQLGASFLSST
jgi:hypothetical protein